MSEQHLHPDSRDVVKMATGLIGTLTALVLGLLIASALPAIARHSDRHGRRADSAAVVYADRRLNSDTIFDNSGVLALRDFRKLYFVCASQSRRHGLSACMCAVVCRRHFSGFGVG
jgi:hypothetical protein